LAARHARASASGMRPAAGRAETGSWCKVAVMLK
jgi:hypothetical protein